jgi:poly(3-hydroxyalkanoate) synthetase
MADSIIARGQAILENQADSSSILQVGIFQTVLMELIESPSGRYVEQNWKTYVSASTDSVVDVVDNTTQDTRLPLDRLSVGGGLLYLYVLDATQPSAARMSFLIKSKPGP